MFDFPRISSRKMFAGCCIALVSLPGPALSGTDAPDAVSVLTNAPIILTAHFDRDMKIAGDSCPSALYRGLKKAGANVLFNPAGFSSFTIGGDLTIDLNQTALRQVNPKLVSEIQVTIEPWWPYRSIRNASHFAKVMFSEPWKEIQKKEATSPYSAVSWGYHRAVLTAGSLKPMVGPSDVPESVSIDDDPKNEWAETDPFKYASVANGEDHSAVFSEMTDHPYNHFKYGTSHQLAVHADPDEVKFTKFVALTTSNILVDTMKLQHGPAVTQDMVAALQAILDQAAVECSRINSEKELAEMKELQSNRTLSPVDLDAFERRRRSEIAKYSSREPQWFDAIQALK